MGALSIDECGVKVYITLTVILQMSNWVFLNYYLKWAYGAIVKSKLYVTNVHSKQIKYFSIKL